MHGRVYSEPHDQGSDPHGNLIIPPHNDSTFLRNLQFHTTPETSRDQRQEDRDVVSMSAHVQLRLSGGRLSVHRVESES